MRSLRVLVSGRVQGVGFRYFVAGEARRLDLAGYVRNLRDGRVEAAFRGDAAQIEAMLAACRRGPPGSRVDDVAASDAGPDALPLPFEIRKDG